MKAAMAELVGTAVFAGSGIIGPAIVQGRTALQHLWIFIVAPIIGGLIGRALYKLVSQAQ